MAQLEALPVGFSLSHGTFLNEFEQLGPVNFFSGELAAFQLIVLLLEGRLSSRNRTINQVQRSGSRIGFYIDL